MESKKDLALSLETWLMSSLVKHEKHGDFDITGFSRDLADFIIADRKRILEPLVKWRELYNKPDYWVDNMEAIDETLKNAGYING